MSLSQTETFETLRANLKARIAEAGKSIAATAHGAGIPPTSLSRFLAGSRNRLDLDTVAKLAVYYGCHTSALLGEASELSYPPPAYTADDANGVRLIPFWRLRPSKLNPRQSFDAEGLAALAESIATHGVLQNLVATEELELIAGERRLRAVEQLVQAKRLPAGYEVPVKLLDGQSVQHRRVLALLENLQRADLPPLDEGEAFKALRDEAGWGTAEIAQAIGKSQRFVQQRLALAEQLRPEARELLSAGRMTIEQARALATADEELQKTVVKKITKGEDWGTQPQTIATDAQRRRFPVHQAKFDVEASGLAVVADEETGARWFADRKAAIKAQQAWAEAKAEELRGRWAWVEFIKGYAPWWCVGGADETKDRKVGGAVVAVEPGGNVTIYEGLQPRERPASAESDAALQARHEAERQAREAHRAAAQAFAAEFGAALAKDPLACFKLLIFERLTGECLLGSPEDPPEDLGPLNALGAEVAGENWRDLDDDGDGPEGIADANALWRRLSLLEEPELIGDWAARAIAISYEPHNSWRGLAPLAPLAVDLAQQLGVAIPEALQPGGDGDE